MGRQTTPVQSRRTVALAIGIYLVALGVRLGVWAEVFDHPTYQALVADMAGNHEFAVQVLDGTLPPNTYYKAPGYSYFLAGVYAVFGVNPTAARIVQIVLTSLTPVLTFLIAQRLFGLGVGVISGLLACVFWTFVYFSTELLDAALACTLYMLLAWLLIVLDDRPWWKWAACGVVLGLGGITRPNILAFAPALAIAIVIIAWRREARNRPPHLPTRFITATGFGNRASAVRRALVHVIALTLGCCVPVLTVTLRNRVVGGEWVLIGAYSGLNFYVANNPHSDSKNGPLLIEDTYYTVPIRVDTNAAEPWARCCLNYILGCRVAESRLGRTPKPGEFSAILQRMGVDFLRDNPGWLARHALMRFCWLFNMYEFHSNRDFYRFRQNSWLLTATSYLHFGIVCPLAVVGLILALSKSTLRTAPMAYLVIMLASLALPAVLFIINARFRLPMVHLLIPFAAYGLVRAVGLHRHGVSWRERTTVLIGLVGLAVFSNTNVFGYWGNHKAYLRAHYVDACERAGRDELLPDAYAELERALEIDMQDPRPSNTTLLLEYCAPMTRLFFFHAKRNNLDKALRYGRAMVEREPLQGRLVIGYFNLLTGARGQADAREMLDVIRRRAGTEHQAVLAACLLGFGRRYGDPTTLTEAAQLYASLAQRDPTDPTLRQGLDSARHALAALTSRQPSAPTSTVTPPR